MKLTRSTRRLCCSACGASFPKTSGIYLLNPSKLADKSSKSLTRVLRYGNIDTYTKQGGKGAMWTHERVPGITTLIEIMAVKKGSPYCYIPGSAGGGTDATNSLRLRQSAIR